MSNVTNMSSKSVSEYYVYAYYDPRNGDAIYIGLGKKKRAFVHWKKGARNGLFNNVLNKIREEGMTPRIEFVAMELFIEQAKELEKQLIALYGRRDLGLGKLCNLTDGGDGAEGYKQTDEAKAATKAGVEKYWATVNREDHGKKISRVFASRTDEEIKVVGDNIKKSRTEDVQARITAAVKARLSTPESKALKVHQLHSAEARAKRKVTMKNTLASPEKREAKRRIASDLWKTPEYREKISKAAKLAWAKRKAKPEQKPTWFMPQGD